MTYRDISGRLIAATVTDARCSWLSVDGWGCNYNAGHPGWHERHRRPDLDVYGPDGVPLDGPRTTAAEYGLMGYALNAGHFTWSHWRNAAADEGARYAEAIRGARAMRSDRFAFLSWRGDLSSHPHRYQSDPPNRFTHPFERIEGMPAESTR